MKGKHSAQTRQDADASQAAQVRPAPADQPRVQMPAQERARAQGQQQARRVKSTITKWRMYGVFGWVAIMLIGGFIGLLFFARPVSSAVEMRNLTPFPEFTAERFLNGSYFTDLSLWYADTYPLREPMVAADHAIDSLFGVTVNGAMVGGNVQADEIPVEEQEPAEVVVLADPPDEHVMAAEIQDNVMDGLYIKDGAAYSIYYFDQLAADTYIAALNKAAERLDGTSTVYSIMSPATSIMLDPEDAKAVGGSDQIETLAYLSTRFDPRVHPIEIVDDLTEHRDEYLYFYTDHHWTQLGAYYAYVALCEDKGIKPIPLDSREHMAFEGFTGTYYDTIASMGEARIDTVDAWFPIGTNEMTYWTEEGDEITGPIVDDAAGEWDGPLKYSGFIAGDQPLEVIHNPRLDDGSSCLVVKDSYGCAFVPLLVDNYEDIHVIDFRYTDKNICDYALENNIKDVIFITGIKIGLTQTVSSTLLAEVSETTESAEASEATDASEASAETLDTAEGAEPDQPADTAEPDQPAEGAEPDQPADTSETA